MRSATVHRVPARLIALMMFLATSGITARAADDHQVPDKTVMVIRDFRLIDKDEFAAQAKLENGDMTDEEIDRQYAQHLAMVRQVQREQYSVARRALQEYGTETIFIEQVVPDDLAKFTVDATDWAKRAAEVDEMRRRAISLQQSLELRRQNGATAEELAEAQQQLGKLRDEVIAFGMDELRIGVTARLLASDGLNVQVKTVETKESLALLQSPADQDRDTENAGENVLVRNSEREKLIARQVAAWLENKDVAILILSGNVDLRDDFVALGLKVQYGMATVPNFPK